MNAKHKLTLACALVCSASLAGGASAAEPGSSPLYPLTAEQALEVDVQGVADALKISPEAARSRLNVQKHARPIVKRIRAQYASRLAGIYIEHTPTHRLVVRLTGYDAVRPEFHQFGADPLEVVYTLGADRTFRSLQKLFDARFAQLGQRMPGVQGGYVDERTGEVVVQVVRDEKAGRVADVKRLVAGHFGVPVRIDTLEAPLQNQVVKGSGSLNFVQNSAPAQCTGAFTVRHVTIPLTRYGLLTAGHCISDSGLFNYVGIDSATHTLTYADDKYDAASDISWLSIGSNPSDVDKVFFADAWREVDGYIETGDLAVEMQVCRYGRNGGYGCEPINSVAYNPGSTCGPTGTTSCSSTFIEVQASGSLCVAGDSGGPWFLIESAVGIHKSGAGTQCVFTPVEHIFGSPLNLQLVM